MAELRLINLTKRFGSRTLFSDLSFEAPPTGLVLLTGPSGCGKTTLFRMIAGLDPDYSGTIIGGGIGAVSYAFQEPRLFPHLDAVANVTLALRARIPALSDAREAAEEALLSLGYARADFGKRPAALSGGMRERVNLARALALPAPILLLDEPEQGLDAALAARLYERIQAEAGRRLCLLISHSQKAELLRPDALLSLSPAPDAVEPENTTGPGIREKFHESPSGS